MSGRKRDDQLAMNGRQPATRHDQAAVRGVRECGDGALDVAGIADVNRLHLHPQRRSHGLDHGELVDPLGYCRVAKDRCSRHTRRDLFEQLQKFRTHSVFDLCKTSGVAVVASLPGGERWWITAEQSAAVVKVIEQEAAQRTELPGTECALSTAGGPDAA